MKCLMKEFGDNSELDLIRKDRKRVINLFSHLLLYLMMLRHQHRLYRVSVSKLSHFNPSL
jgi:hypothetical protein